MPDKKRRKKTQKTEKPDIMHGRSFEGASYGATERERTEDARRIPGQTDDEFVTDAEMEVREANSSPRDEDDD